jgi:hypothetical protein
MIEKVEEGTILWQPPEALKENSNMARYLRWLSEEKGLHFDDYHALWRWSVEDLEGFWGSLWEFFDVRAYEPYTRVLGRREMPGAEWFPGATLNYAEHALRRAEGRTDETAILYRSEARPTPRALRPAAHAATPSRSSPQLRLASGRASERYRIAVSSVRPSARLSACSA